MFNFFVSFNKSKRLMYQLYRLIFIALLASLVGCASDPEEVNPIESEEFKFDRREDGLVGVIYIAHLIKTGPELSRELSDDQPRRTKNKRNGRDPRLATRKQAPYILSTPSNTDVLREHIALNALEQQLRERSLCPVNYDIDIVEHFRSEVRIAAYCTQMKATAATLPSARVN
ncbi:hypothetical protein NAF29_06355 [Echinimonas agarilytica]|uniref:Lipoprotein n=2 Tax=Echinimonas agarilytica TaxID=1215918 RepID=A0AA42B7H7_9GAMM|nr:hypothetical protein [Echinimonas agarilytica]